MKCPETPQRVGWPRLSLAQVPTSRWPCRLQDPPLNSSGKPERVVCRGHSNSQSLLVDQQDWSELITVPTRTAKIRMQKETRPPNGSDATAFCMTHQVPISPQPFKHGPGATHKKSFGREGFDISQVPSIVGHVFQPHRCQPTFCSHVSSGQSVVSDLRLQGGYVSVTQPA